MVQLLTGYEVDVNLMLEHLMTPLHLAGRYSCRAITKLLIENEADPNTTIGWGFPLQAVAQYNNFEVTQILLKSGGTVSTQCLRNCCHGDHSIVLFWAYLKL